jgi:hypothetical protein
VRPRPPRLERTPSGLGWAHPASSRAQLDGRCLASAPSRFLERTRRSSCLLSHTAWRGLDPLGHRPPDGNDLSCGVRKPFLVAAAVASLAVVPVTSAAGPPGSPGDGTALSRCIAQNQFRYNQPDQAAVLQYIDIVALCRSILARGGDVQFRITPLSGGQARSTRTTKATPGNEGAGTAPTSDARQRGKSGSTSRATNHASLSTNSSAVQVEAALAARKPTRDAAVLSAGPRLRVALGLAVGIVGAAMIAAVAARRRKR